MQITRSRFFIPLVAVGLGAAMLAAQWIAGDPRNGLISLAIMAAFGALVLLGGRSETVRGLRGDGRDERFHRIDVEATAIAGSVVFGTIIVASIVQMARGEDIGPFGWLAAIAAISYLGAVAVLRLRG